MKNRERKMKGLSKLLAGFAALLLTLACTGTGVFASTGIYVGKDVSVEGTTLIGVSEEADTGISSIPVVLDKGLLRKGDAIEAGNGYSYELTEDSAKMTIVKMMGYTDYAGWTSCASNEYGVSVIANITTDCNIDAQSADPFIYEGISEEVIAKVLCATSKSAKEAADLLCSIYDETGAQTAETVFITDPDGAWVVENFTGHEYIAAKLPDDKIATFANDPVIRTADEKSGDMIISGRLLSLPEENGFAVHDEDGNLDLILTYNYDNSYNDESHLRGWVGHDLFAPSEELDYDPEEGYDVFFAPDEKVGIRQAFAFFRNRFEGTAYDLKDEDNRFYYGINNQMVGNVNLVQVFDDVPAGLSSVIWTTPANPTASPFIPIPAIADKLPDALTTDVTDDVFAADVLQFDFAKLNSTIYPKREVYGASVRKYWEGMEAVSADDVVSAVHGKWQDEFDSSTAGAAVSDYIRETVDDAAENCTRISNELDWYLFRNGVKNASVPDDEIEPFQCAFDAVAYAHANGWETTVSDDRFTAEKDGKKIEVVTDGDDKGTVTFTGFDNDKLIEDFIGEDGSGANDAEDLNAEAEADEEKVEAEIATATEETENTKGTEETETEVATEKEVEAAAETEAEATAEAEAVEEATKAAAQQIEVDTIAALQDFFAEKINNIPRDGWAENEIAKEINSVSNGVVNIVGKYFDGDVEKLIDMDYRKVGEDILTDEDVAKVGDKIVATGMDLSALLENYFLSLYEDVSGDVVSGRITQQGVEKILAEAETDIEGIAKLYLEGIEGKFSEVFNTNLSDEEIEEIVKELSEGSLQLMEDYGGVDLDALGLGDLDIDSLTDADVNVVITLNEMDDDVISGLSSMLGVDVRGVIDRYMDAINSSDSKIKIVEENHESKAAQSAPDPIVLAAIDKQATDEDIIVPQEVIDVLNEAIIEAAEERGETIDESELLSNDAINEVINEAVDNEEAEEEATDKADIADLDAAASEDADAAAAQQLAAGTYSAFINGVRNTDGKVLLPAFMLKYFN